MVGHLNCSDLMHYMHHVNARRLHAKCAWFPLLSNRLARSGRVRGVRENSSRRRSDELLYVERSFHTYCIATY